MVVTKRCCSRQVKPCARRCNGEIGHCDVCTDGKHCAKNTRLTRPNTHKSSLTTARSSLLTPVQRPSSSITVFSTALARPVLISRRITMLLSSISNMPTAAQLHKRVAPHARALHAWVQPHHAPWAHTAHCPARRISRSTARRQFLPPQASWGAPVEWKAAEIVSNTPIASNVRGGHRSKIRQ